MSNYALADNPNTPPETLALLANDEEYWVRYRVAQNPNTSPETLERLANDNNIYVRWHVAFNHNTLPETLACLADDGYYVRLGVANNPNTPQYIKTYLRLKNVL